jgi:hypothetical protein
VTTSTIVYHATVAIVQTLVIIGTMITGAVTHQHGAVLLLIDVLIMLLSASVLRHLYLISPERTGSLR